MEEEIWKDIPGLNGKYCISNYGNVKSVNYHNSKIQKNIKSNKDKQGYLRIKIHGITYKVHRLVALVFIPNPYNFPCVNHKDENKSNNHLDNLEWCNHSYNAKYGKSAIERANKLRNGACSKKVEQLDKKTGEIIQEYPSANEIQRIKGYERGNINKCCRGERKTAYGYKWRFKL